MAYHQLTQVPPPESAAVQPILIEYKPIDHINVVINHLHPFAVGQSLSAGKSLMLSNGQTRFCCLLTDGHASIRRITDKLTVSHVTAPMVIGIAELLFPQQMHFIQAKTDIEFALIPENIVLNCLTENNLWCHLTYIQAYIIQGLAMRDALLTGRTTYEIIRNQLQMLINEPPFIRNTTSASCYILERTQLSRSGIMKVLSQLRQGNYIVMEKGILNSINHLPVKY